MRIAVRLALLAALWLLAWGDFTLANVVSGIVVAGALLIAFPLRRPGHPHRRASVAGIVALTGYVGAQLVASNVVMAREVLRRRPRVRPGVLAHRLAEPSEEVVTLMTSIIALSPGTMTVDVDADSTTIYVHFFQLDDVAAARRSLRRLEQRVVDAIAPRRAGDVGAGAPEVSP